MKWLPCLLAAGLAACGPDVGTTDDGGGTQSSGSGSSETVTTGAGSCEQFLSTPDVGPSVTFRVRNESGAPIYVLPAGCGGGTTFGLTDQDGNAVTWAFSECFPTVCEAFLDAEDCRLGCPDCGVPSLVRIADGASDHANWSGSLFTPMQMTAACAPGEECQRECLRLDQAPPGTYNLTLNAYRSCEGTCECDPPGDSCGIWDAATGTDEFVLEAAFTYPDETVVEVVAR